MKNWLTILALGFLLYGCKEAASKTEKPVAEDSLNYYPHTPAKLDKAAFRHYYRLVSGYFDSMLLRRGFSGGMLVAKNGEIVYEDYQGFADSRKRIAITDSTSFHIASTTKTFTGVAILHLVQQGKLSLEDSIQHFFPGLPYPGITVKMLL
ncbi:MAG: beta-lactamase family protein, partial [Chitinophagaceae bacterium]|nr:beta-lactamase family protein [Chitinophagaceae bacterium]